MEALIVILFILKRRLFPHKSPNQKLKRSMEDKNEKVDVNYPTVGSHSAISESRSKYGRLAKRKRGTMKKIKID